jgi:tRNA threonylcarbamoyladenosine biosynthesis protein TsaB
MTLALVVDTTILGASLGLFDQSRSEFHELWTAHYLGRDGSARILNSLLADGLKATASDFGHISHIAVSVGPGSFTGIKVGLAWVYGLAAGASIPLKFAAMSALEEAGVHTRLALASERLAFVVGSTKTHGYLAEIDERGSAQSLLINLESAADRQFLSARLNGIAMVLGNSWPEFEIVTKALNISVTGYSCEATARSAVSGMMQAAFRCRHSGFDTTMPLPRYLRQSSAEEKLAATGG